MKHTLKILSLVALVSRCPSLAQAHSIAGAANARQDGFNHPLHGWDHLLVMVAVGLWASDQIPASFGATNFFGMLNPTDGGDSGRYSFQGEWQRHDEFRNKGPGSVEPIQVAVALAARF